MYQPSFCQTFRHLTGAEDKPLSTTYGITQDNDGFMWFATNSGLYRYDSRTLRHYSYNFKDAGTIASDMLKGVCVDSKGNLWVVGTGGLDLYQRATNNFKHFEHKLPNIDSNNNVIYFITVSRDNRVFIGTHFGLFSINLEGEKLTITSHIKNKFGGAFREIRCMTQSANGDIWAGTSDGLIHVPRNGKEPALFKMKTDKKFPLRNQFVTILDDNRGTIWMGSDGGGLVRFNVATKQFQIVKTLLDANGSLPVVNQIIPDQKGAFWLATKSGLAHWDPVSSKVEWFNNMADDMFSLADNMIYSAFIDRDKGLWLGSRMGISYSHPNSPRFVKWSIDDPKGKFTIPWIGKNKKGVLWLIKEDQKKLFLADGTAQKQSSFDLDLSPHADYRKFYLDEQATLWAGGNSLLTRFDLKNRVYRHYPMQVDSHQEPVNGRVYDMLEDRHGRFWVIGAFGALLFDKFKGRFQRIDSVTYSQSIFEDATGNIWIGGGDEVFLLQNKSKDFEVIPTEREVPSSNWATVWRVIEDSTGRIWAATRRGLQQYDTRRNRFFLDKTVRGRRIEDIVVDPKGYLWLASESQLLRYHPDRGTLQNYGYSDGLPFNSLLNPASGVAGEQGVFYFTTSKGAFSLDTKTINSLTKPSTIAFTSLKISSVEVRAADETGALPQSISQVEKIILKHTQNNFSLDFALLSYYRSDKNQYAYKLEGADADWRYTTSPSAAYMNLPPGLYQLRVKAANGDGHWLNEEATMYIEVTPPWWKTWYAFLIYIGLFIATTYSVGRFFWIRNSFKRETALNLAKLDFFTNVSHEIRTHLSLISAPLEKAFQESGQGTSTRNYLTYARNNSNRLSLLVNELLDFRKIQSGTVRLRIGEHDVIKIIKNVISGFEHVANEKGIQTSQKFPKTPVLLWFDISQMQKVFYNLLSNAYKFSQVDGRVVVRLVEISHEVIITVEDNGEGMSQEQVRKLFTYYYQADSQKPGYGIGLALSRSIVEQHHGYLTAESHLATGTAPGRTVLTVRMLRGNAHFRADDVVPQNGDLESNLVIDAIPTHFGDNKTSFALDNSILVVEDNDELRTFIRELFHGEFNILEAEDGLRGLELANHHIPDLIISDVMMPGINGIELVRRLKRGAVTSHIPVILLTARTQNDQIVEALRTGVDDYLVKPFDSRILHVKVCNLIQLRDELKERYRQSALIDLTPGNSDLRNANEVFITKLATLVKNNLTNSDFGVYELCAEVGISVSALYRKMRSLTGMTVNEFVKSIRLNEAKKLLESGGHNVNEVSLIVGFDDAKYFSREFRKAFGKKPVEIKGRLPS